MSGQAGEIIEERYRLIDKIGEGAHGVVFRARVLATREEVAIKFLSEAATADPEFVERFEREALAMIQLRGTSTVRALDLRTHEGKRYLVMEMLHGYDLDYLLKRAESAGGRLKPDKMLEFLSPIAATLEVAHAQSIIHRDVKPSNIFIIDDAHGGGVRLMDFGIAKLLAVPTQLTAVGTVMGTPSYIAPEAWGGDPRAVDHRIDVYSLGVVVYRCLAGRVPYRAKTLADMTLWSRTGTRPSLFEHAPYLPAEVDDWVLRALAIDPDDRHPTIREMWADLEQILVRERESPFS